MKQEDEDQESLHQDEPPLPTMKAWEVLLTEFYS